MYLESTIAFLYIDYSSTKLSPHLRIRETLTNYYIDPGNAKSNPRSCLFSGNLSLAPGAIFRFQETEFYPLGSPVYDPDRIRTGFGNKLAESGSCRAPGTLLLDPRVNILPSEVAESPHKIPSPDLRTNLRHPITPGKAKPSAKEPHFRFQEVMKLSTGT